MKTSILFLVSILNIFSVAYADESDAGAAVAQEYDLCCECANQGGTAEKKITLHITSDKDTGSNEAECRGYCSRNKWHFRQVAAGACS